jgi:hypothetical protein
MNVRVRSSSDYSTNSQDILIKNKIESDNTLFYLKLVYFFSCINFVIIASFIGLIFYIYFSNYKTFINLFDLFNLVGRFKNDYDNIINDINDITNRANILIDQFNNTDLIDRIANITFIVENLYKKIDNELYLYSLEQY